MVYSIENPPSTPRKQKKGAPLSIAASPTAQRKAVVERMAVATPGKTTFYIDLESPPLHELKRCKEIDSGVPAWETPTPIVVEPEVVNASSIPPSHQTIGHYRSSLELWQSMFPGRFCVFVGNLPNQYDDAALSQALIRMFSVYGVCTGAVHRGKAIFNKDKVSVRLNFDVDRRMPYAHIQYDNLASAVDAVNQIHGPHQLDGRMLRTEINKAHRNVLVYVPWPAILHVAAVVHRMSQWGKVMSAAHTTAQDLARGLPAGIRVRFESHVGPQRLQRTVGDRDAEFFYQYKI